MHMYVHSRDTFALRSKGPPAGVCGVVVLHLQLAQSQKCKSGWPRAIVCGCNCSLRRRSAAPPESKHSEVCFL